MIADAAIDAVVCDQPTLWREFNLPLVVSGSLPLRPAASVATSHETEWLLLTSGTTGAPKVVSHSLEGLTGAITAEGPAKGPPPVWATFYDMRRYGGLQIFLRADRRRRLDGAVRSEGKYRRPSDSPDQDGRHAHLRYTLALAQGADESGIATFRPKYVRLSGEIADQAVLDSLRKAFPDSSIGHALLRPRRASALPSMTGSKAFRLRFSARVRAASK